MGRGAAAVADEFSAPGDFWEVVGGAGVGGIIARVGKSLTSDRLPERLATGSVVRQEEQAAGRLCYSLIIGSGPPTGWVSLRASGKPLLEGVSEPAPPSRLVLDTTQAVPRALTRATRTFDRVCVFGPHHSCTGAMMRELPRFFEVSIMNKHYADNPSLWKHTIVQEPLPLADNVFCVCLVKDPAFWVQSLGRDPAAGTFYEISPLASWGAGVMVPQEPEHIGQLFDPVIFDDHFFPDALAVWEATARAYTREDLLPSWRCAVVRSEDFLFQFDAVMRDLAARGLALREPFAAAGLDAVSFEPVEATAKDDTHPTCTRRGRTELLAYYSDPGNRHRGLSPPQVARVRGAAPDLVRALRYGDRAADSWRPPAPRVRGG